MNTKKLLPLLLVLSILCSFWGTQAVSADDNGAIFQQTTEAIDKWNERGIISGPDMDFRPDDNLTRGEMAVIIDRIMKYQAKSETTFSDLGHAYYTDAMLKVNAAGIMSSEEGMIRPNDSITHEEAAVILGRAFSMTQTFTNEPKFEDNKDISYWAMGFVNALKSRGYINTSDNNFNPNESITHAQIAEILDAAVNTIYSKSGTYSGDIGGTVVVNTPGVVLENMKIQGDLILADGIGDGKVVLNNVTVKGNMVVRCGKGAVNINGPSKMSNLIVLAIAGDTNIALQDGVQVDMVAIENGSKNVTLSGKIPNLTIKAKRSTVTVQDAVIPMMYIQAEGARLITGKNATVDNITVKTAAIGADIAVQKESEIKFVKAAADRMSITGDGILSSATVSGKNCDVQTNGTKVLSVHGTEGLKTATGVTVTNQPAAGKLDTVKPNRLKTGDTIGVIAPCNGLKPTGIRVAIETMIESGYKVKLPENLFKFTNGFSATPQERADDLNDLILDDSVTAIFFAGGEVSNEILPYIDYDEVRKHPKVICSYSDSTSLLNALYARAGLETFYGSSLTRIFQDPKPYSYKSFEKMILQGNAQTFTPNSEWKALRGGKAEGVLIGGYLLNFALLQNTDYFPYDKDQKYILFIEENSRFNLPAAASRYFSHIEQSGLLDHVSGILIGEYSTDNYPDYTAILQRIADKYQIPVITCKDFGHGNNAGIIPIGIHATLDADNLMLTFQENQVKN